MTVFSLSGAERKKADKMTCLPFYFTDFLIYAVIIKKGSTTLPFGPCLSLGGIATLYLQALF